MNGPIPHPDDYNRATQAFKDDLRTTRIETSSFSPCSKRFDARFASSGLVFLNPNTKGNPYLNLADMPDDDMLQQYLPPKLRPWYVAHEYDGDLCPWTGPEKYKPKWWYAQTPSATLEDHPQTPLERSRSMHRSRMQEMKSQFASEIGESQGGLG
jgi:hypothetical protein